MKNRVYFIRFKTHKKILLIIIILTPFYLTELFIRQIKYQYIFVLASHLLSNKGKEQIKLIDKYDIQEISYYMMHVTL